MPGLHKNGFPRIRGGLSQLARATRNQAHDLEIVRQPIHLWRLPEAFNGLRIAQLSDIHHGLYVDADHIVAAVALTNQLRPDLIVLTGDFINHSRYYIDSCAELLGRLEAPHGVWAVLGNHDFWTDGDHMARSLRRQHIQVLRNSRTDLTVRGDSLSLLGVDDPTLGLGDLKLAARGARRDRARILLAHNPSIIRQAASQGIDLVLAGHTHGGQISFRSRRSKRRSFFRFYRGWGQLGATQIYVNRGLGTVIVPIRVQCPPEITLIELGREKAIRLAFDAPTYPP